MCFTDSLWNREKWNRKQSDQLQFHRTGEFETPEQTLKAVFILGTPEKVNFKLKSTRVLNC